VSNGLWYSTVSEGWLAYPEILSQTNTRYTRGLQIDARKNEFKMFCLRLSNELIMKADCISLILEEKLAWSFAVGITGLDAI
jgi:hypothetical protein